MGSNVYLRGIATAVPKHRIPQQQILEFMKRNVELDSRKSRLLNLIYSRSAIEYRHSVIPDFALEPAKYEFFPSTPESSSDPTTAERNRIFVLEANLLAAEAAQTLIADLDIDPSKITHLITASCTGFSAPGFDFHLVRALPLNLDTERYHLGFMGCFAAMPAMRLARHICRSNSGANVLFVNVEICTLHFRTADDLDSLVANSLFADGASAALVSSEVPDGEPKALLRGFATTIVPDSEDDMAWIIGDHGFDMRLSSYVPRVLGAHMGPLFETLLSRYQLDLLGVDHYAVHPGGRAIVDRVADSLELERSRLAPSYDVLANYGNMSSATIMFVLKSILESGTGGRVVAAAFGPGLTVESACLEIA